MKKFLLLSLIILLPKVTFGQQLTGDGTFASPFSGSITTNTSWNGSVYIGGNISIQARLTIEPGTTIAFTNASSIITVVNRGSINASGNAQDSIVFNADFDGNELLGEDGETWQHIVIYQGAIASFSYCSFTNAYYPSNSSINAFGGAFLIYSKNVSFDNCSFSNNENRWGGSIFVNGNGSITINNCIFSFNETRLYASAIYFWKNSSGNISNSIFISSNTNKRSIVAFHSYSDLSVINCTFISGNTSVAPIAIDQSAAIDNPPESSEINITNCVMFGSLYSVYYTITEDNSDVNIENCAYQAVPRDINSTSTNPVNINNSFILNSNNNAANGPHFADLENRDFSITYESPLFDAGTTIAPTNVGTVDLAGNPRVAGTIDIGAYELQCSVWKEDAATENWTEASNWKGGIPTNSSNIIIPNSNSSAPNYPTLGGPNVTIGEGHSFTIASQAQATVGSITNNGTLLLESDNSGHSASLIFDNYSGNGTTNVELYLIGGEASAGNYRWHYISSPFTDLSVSPFTTGTNASMNLAQFDERSGDWIAYDGYNYTSGLTDGTQFQSLITGRGYNYYHGVSHEVILTGTLNSNSENYIETIVNNGTGTRPGWNLLGNPYTAGLSWDEIVEANANIMENVNAGVYFTKDNVQYTYINGVSTGVPLGVGTTNPEGTQTVNNGIIPPMQGFFVRYYGDAQASFTIPASARTHGAPALYKGNGSDIPLIRLLLEDATKKYDDAVVRFDEKAVAGLDRNFDGLKAFKKEENYLISTFYGETEYSINGMPFPETGKSFEIPVYLNLPASGNFKISASQLQNLDSYQFFLTDSLTGEPVELAEGTSFEFTTEATGEITGRFTLTVTPRSLPPDPEEGEEPNGEGEEESPVNPPAEEGDQPNDEPDNEEEPATGEEPAEENPTEEVITGIENNFAGKNEFTIYQSYSNINIIPLYSIWDGKIARITLINLAGQRIQSENVGLQTDLESSVAAPANKGIYLVEIVADGRRYVGKIIIK